MGGSANAGEAFRYCVRLARITLGICVHCRTYLSGNRCRDCQKLHPEDCCWCVECGCACSATKPIGLDKLHAG